MIPVKETKQSSLPKSKMEAIVTVGISASGKSTFSREMVQKGKGVWVDINRDDIRFEEFCGGFRDWDKYKFTKAKEKRVSEIADQMLTGAAEEGLNVIISDTNLNPVNRETLINRLKDLGYTVEVKPFPITLEEAWKRDARRANGVGHSVIARQWKQWLKYTGRKQYVPDETKPDCIICDIDGTLADMHNPDGSRIRGPFEWDKVGLDYVCWPVARVLNGVYAYEDVDIIFLSGRDSCCREETKRWIDNTGLWYSSLYMRPEGSFQKDTELKEEMFWENIAEDYNVLCVFDDRPSVCRMWTDLGLKVFNVGNPYIEF